MRPIRSRGLLRVPAAAAILLQVGSLTATASDHLDSPSVIADPRTDIGDLYAWMSPDRRRLNLVMTIVGHSLSERIDYAFHIDSGPRFNHTAASIDLRCRFGSATEATCQLGGADRLHGDASHPEGLVSRRGTFRLFAGLRDDPFFNNVRGTRAMYGAVNEALAGTARYDDAGCPQFSAAQSAAIEQAWKHTDGGPPANFLRGWTPQAIVVAIDVRAITLGGPFVAVWSSTAGPEGQIDRAARPLTGNALLATLGSDEEQDALKERYNRARPDSARPFVDEIAKGIALYDGLDGRCGDSLLFDPLPPATQQYRPLAAVLADDRLWVNTKSGRCTQLFAVERAALNREPELAADCGGRAPTYDAVNVYRSLLAGGRPAGIDDGVHHDDKVPSDSVFPFLAAADAAAATP